VLVERLAYLRVTLKLYPSNLFKSYVCGFDIILDNFHQGMTLKKFCLMREARCYRRFLDDGQFEFPLRVEFTILNLVNQRQIRESIINAIERREITTV